MEQGRDGGACARTNLSLTMLGHVWHTHSPKCPLLLGGAPPCARREARRGRHDGRHGARLYRLLLCAGARLPPLLEVIDVEEVPACKASESACQGRTERGEPGTSGGASGEAQGCREGYPARHGPLQGRVLCRRSGPSVGSLPWSPEGGRARWEAGLGRGRPDVLGGGGACSRDACSRSGCSRGGCSLGE